MKFTLFKGHRANYESYASLDNAIAFKSATISQAIGTKNAFTVERQLGLNFKSNIHLYNIPGNINGKMSQRIYIDPIFRLIVKSWLEANGNFLLEEDGDSKHEPSKNNPVKDWKLEYSLKVLLQLCLIPRSRFN